MNSGWEHINNFKISENAGYSGTKSLMADCQNTFHGTVYSIITPPVNLSETKHLNPRLSLMVGYAKRYQYESEIIRIYGSNDCGNSFKILLEAKNNQLVSPKNYALLQAGFIPQSKDDWQRIQVNLFNYFESTSAIFKIEVISGRGNSVYIDDINISQFYTGIQDIESYSDLNVFPNPSYDIFNITFNKEAITAQSQVYVADISGRKVAELLSENSNNGVTHMIFNPKAFQLKSGVYFLILKTNNGILRRKLVFLN
jgi:hypothetical protein